MLSRALSLQVVQALRDECNELIERGTDLIEAGCVLEPVGTASGAHPSRTSAQAYGELRPLLTRKLILGPHSLHPIVQAVLLASCEPQACNEVVPTPNPEKKTCLYFFNEHYIVKPPQSESRFCWHTDAAEQLMMCYIDPYSSPYVSMWCPLDDMTSANGSLEVWPGSHRRGVEPGEATQGVLLTPCPGSVVLFASTLWHRSGRNDTEVNRRAYYLQYSLNPIMAKEGPVSRAIPISLEESVCPPHKPEQA